MFFLGKAGSFPSEKGSCKLTLVLEKKQQQEGEIIRKRGKKNNIKCLLRANISWYNHLDPGGMGGIWVWGVEAGVGGFKSPPSAMELLVDWGVWGPWREPDPAVEQRDASVWNKERSRQIWHMTLITIKNNCVFFFLLKLGLTKWILLNCKCTVKIKINSTLQLVPGEGGWTLAAWFFLLSVKISGGGSSPRSILHSNAYRHWIYCFFKELAALLDVPTFREVARSRHFLFLFT